MAKKGNFPVNPEELPEGEEDYGRNLSEGDYADEYWDEGSEAEAEAPVRVRRKRRSAVKAYLLAIAITLVVAGGGALYLYYRFADVLGSALESPSKPSESLVYAPDIAESQTILCVLQTAPTSKGAENTAFMVVRFLPTQRALYLLPLSPYTAVSINTKTAPLYEFYDEGGILMGVKAASEAINLPIHRYLKLDRESFTSLVDVFGGVSYRIPYNITWTDPLNGDQYPLSEGPQSLDGIKLNQLFSYPQYKEGESYRIRLQGMITAEMLNQSAKSGLKGNIEECFLTMVNKGESNLSRNDLDFRKKAIGYCLAPGYSPAIFISPAGQWSGEGFDRELFYLSVDFRNTLAETFADTPLVELG